MKKKQQTYNVIFIWDKRPNVDLKLNLKPSPKPFSTMYWFWIILIMVNFNLIIKDHIHGLVVKLSSNNEQDINTLGILWILIMYLMLTPNP
jgi:hypothetical protein